MTKNGRKRPIDINAEADRIIYPEHGTGRTAALATCGHCGGKPLIIRRCPVGRLTSTFCAVCEKCGFHRRVANLQDLPTATSNATAKRLGDLETHVRELRAQTRKLFAQRKDTK